MPSLRELADNLPNFNYYSGPGNFTQNRIGYGDNKPLITVPPGFRWSPSNIDEGFLQFGAVTVASRTGIDVLRISKFLTTTPQGPLFVLKQLALQRSNPKIEYEGEEELSRRGKEKYGPTRQYTPLPLLAQVAGNAIGARFKRHGVVPEISDTSQYESYILAKDLDNKNRLVTLAKKLSDPNNQGISGDVLEYRAGPQSFYGIGNTRIRRVGFILQDYNVVDGSGFTKMPIRDIVNIEGQIGLVNGSKSLDKNSNLTTLNDFTASLYTFSEKYDYRNYKNDLLRVDASTVRVYDLPATDYAKLNLRDRIGVAEARSAFVSTTNNVQDYSNASANNHDKVNALSLYEHTSADPGVDDVYDFNGVKVSYNPSDLVAVRDLIKFRIKSIDNDAPSKGVYMVFRAYIKNIRRTFTSKWNPYTYVGRGESFYIYEGFTETVSLSFDIAASSRYEMKPLYQKLNYLISTLSPDYKDSLMRGNLTELTVGNFLLYQPGIITSLDLTVDEDSNWEIAIDEPEGGKDSDMHELPQLIKCTMTFIPIYNFLPRKSEFRSPYIGIDLFPNVKPGQKWMKPASI